jgi:hypothetical protein
MKGLKKSDIVRHFLIYFGFLMLCSSIVPITHMNGDYPGIYVLALADQRFSF